MEELISAFEALYDESWLPEELLSKYSPVECLAENMNCATLLLESKEGDGRCIAKCYSKDDVVVSVTENEILSVVTHKGLPKYIGKYENDQTVCVLREYIEGQPFVRLMGGSGFSAEETAEFALKVCDILGYLHDLPSPVLHRDIKPENIVVNENRVYLIDFGISRILRDAEKRDTQIAVSASYAPPEQFGFLPTDARSDIYALGVVMNEMMTGSTNLQGNIPDGGMGRIISKCTAFSPDDRYRSVKQLARDLRRWRYRKVRAAVLSVASVAAAALVVAAGIAFAKYRPETTVQSQPVTPLLEEIDQSRMTSDNWSYVLTGSQLTLTGRGTLSEGIEWAEEYIDVSDVTRLVLGDGVTGVDAQSLGRFWKLKDITLPAAEVASADYGVLSSLNKLNFVSSGADPETGISWTYDRKKKTLTVLCDGTGSGILAGEGYWHNIELVDGSGIRHAVIGEGVREIGFNMFWDYHKLESFSLPSTLEKIDPSNFAETYSLVSVTVHPDNERFCVEDGVLYGYSENDGLGSRKDKIYFVPRNFSGRFSIAPGTEILGGFSFAGCREITGVDIPSSLVRIEGSVFESADKITDFWIQSGSRFRFSSLTKTLSSVEIETTNDGRLLNSMTIVRVLPVQSGHYRIPGEYDRVYIQDAAFSGCDRLTEVTIPESVVSIGSAAFLNCTSLKKINFPRDITALFAENPQYHAGDYFGYAAFEKCGVTSVTIPEGVTEISYYCFVDCRELTDVTVPDSMCAIGDYAFAGCVKLAKVTMNREGVYFGNGVFDKCGQLDFADS